MGETEELHAALESILLGMVEEGELELAARRGASSIAGPLLLLLESRADEVRDGSVDLCDWLLERKEVVELYLDGPAVAARIAPVLARLDGEADGPAHDPALVAAIARDLDDAGARLVYADWLTERGDPRGDLIAVQAARLDRPDDPRLLEREARLLREHRSHFFGELPDDVELLRVRFHLGWIDEVWIGDEETRALLEELAGLESARFLRSLTIENWKTDQSFAIYTRPSLRAHLQTLQLGGERSVVDRLQLAWLHPAPRLARLDVSTHQAVFDGNQPLPSLRFLRCRRGAIDLTLMGSPRERFPALEELHLDGDIARGFENLRDDVEVIGPLFDDPPPRLRLVSIAVGARARIRGALERRFAGSRLAALGATLELPVPRRADRYDAVAE